MKQYRFLSIIILVIFFIVTGTVQGYIITIDAPAEVVKGIPLVVTGSTTFPEDAYFDIVLFYSKYTAGEVARSNVIVDKTQQFRVDFDTKDLEKGQYKVEVHDIYSNNEKFVEQELGSSSIVTRIVQITDRSDEITITSPVEVVLIIRFLIRPVCSLRSKNEKPFSTAKVLTKFLISLEGSS